MNDDDDWDAYIAAMAAAMALTIRAEWRAAVAANLAATARLAELVAAFTLPDATEPAPVFEA